MAFTRLNSLPFSLLILFSLLVIAFAADYGNDGIPADSPLAKAPKYEGSMPNGEDKKPINYGEKPITYSKPQGHEEKLKYGSKPEAEEKPNYGTTKPNIYYKPKPEGEEKPKYSTNQYNYKPKAEEKKEKPAYVKKPEEEKKPNYETKQYTYTYTPKTTVEKQKPAAEYEKKPYSIAIEGFVYCKKGSGHYPIPGAFANVICKAVDEVGVVKTVPICSVPTDAKGYFYAIVSNSSNLKLKDCKAYLKSSPVKTCNVATDVNKGISGFPLSGDYRVLHEKRTNLYSARPFFFTSYEPKPAVPNGY